MKLLLPYDGSAYSEAAVAFVAARAAMFGPEAEVALLNVQLPVSVGAWLPDSAVLGEAYDVEARRLLQPPADRLKAAGLKVTAGYRVGPPGLEVSDAVNRDGSDLVVMGSHGRTALAGLVLGSVASTVLSHTRVPLLLLRASEPPASPALKVGIAVDGSPYGEAAARYVATHRAFFGEAARFSLLHAVADYSGLVIPGLAEAPVPLYSLEKVESYQAERFDAATQRVRAALALAGISAKAVRLVGDAGDEIAAYATREGLDLLVLGSHGRGAFTAMILGSVATRVAAQCRTPLLLVRT